MDAPSQGLDNLEMTPPSNSNHSRDGTTRPPEKVRREPARGLMKPLGEFDQEYRNQVVTACTKAIVGLTHDPASNTVVLRNGEVVDALLEIVATFLATSTETATPRGTRLMVDEIGKRLRGQISANRQNFAAHGTPFNVSEFGGYH